MRRVYNNSTLIQKQIIKYGKMQKDSFGYVFSVKGNVNGRTAVWRLGINVKRKMVWHFGHGFSKIGRYFTWCTFSNEKRSVLNQK